MQMTELPDLHDGATGDGCQQNSQWMTVLAKLRGRLRPLTPDQLKVVDALINELAVAVREYGYSVSPIQQAARKANPEKFVVAKQQAQLLKERCDARLRAIALALDAFNKSPDQCGQSEGSMARGEIFSFRGHDYGPDGPPNGDRP